MIRIWPVQSAMDNIPDLSVSFYAVKKKLPIWPPFLFWALANLFTDQRSIYLSGRFFDLAISIHLINLHLENLFIWSIFSLIKAFLYLSITGVHDGNQHIEQKNHLFKAKFKQMQRNNERSWFSCKRFFWYFLIYVREGSGDIGENTNHNNLIDSPDGLAHEMGKLEREIPFSPVPLQVNKFSPSTSSSQIIFVTFWHLIIILPDNLHIGWMLWLKNDPEKGSEQSLKRTKTVGGHWQMPMPHMW